MHAQLKIKGQKAGNGSVDYFLKCEKLCLSKNNSKERERRKKYNEGIFAGMQFMLNKIALTQALIIFVAQ